MPATSTASSQPEEAPREVPEGISEETGSLPEEARQAAAQGNEAALLAWLSSGGRVNATCGEGAVSGITALMTTAGNGHERLVDVRGQRVNYWGGVATADGAGLNSAHSHFLLVDSGSTGKRAWGAERLQIVKPRISMPCEGTSMEKDEPPESGSSMRPMERTPLTCRIDVNLSARV